MTDLFATIEAADPQIAKLRKNASLPLEDHTDSGFSSSNEGAKADMAYLRMSLMCRHSPGYGCEFCRRLNEPAHIARAPAHLEAPPLRQNEVAATPAHPEEKIAQNAFKAVNLNILSLDLGTTTGWAVLTRDGRTRSGSFRLDPNKLGGNGRRWIAFREWLTATAREVGGVQVVYVEDVRRHVSNLSARVYCGYLAMLEAWCAANNVRLEGVGVGTIKKAFTGKGNADKGAMIAEARRRSFAPSTDDEADAVAILSYALTEEA